MSGVRALRLLGPREASLCLRKDYPYPVTLGQKGVLPLSDHFLHFSFIQRSPSEEAELLSPVPKPVALLKI